MRCIGDAETVGAGDEIKMKMPLKRNIARAGVLLFIAIATACSLVHRERQDNVVLIVIDTIRPDRLGCYGFSLGTSPHIDKLAREGVLFEKAVTCAPVTLPSVSTILTSTYPHYHNVRYNGKFFLHDSSITLAEVLQEKGYATAAFIGGFPLDSRFKTDQGFELFDDDFSVSVKKKERSWIGHEVEGFERTAAEVNERVFRWLEEKKNEKFFLMVHYFDPHWPYEPPPPYDALFDSPYNGEVAYTDEQVGRLLKKLESLGLKEKTLVVLAGDHGEGLGAHKELTHGQFLFDTTMLVPLILSHESLPKGRRIGEMAKTLDIMPTILSILRITEGSSEMQGVSLLPLLKGAEIEEPILLETLLPYYESDDLNDIPVKLSGLRTREWKLVYVMMEKETGKEYVGQLYHVGRDPLELFDVMGDNRETYNLLMDQMINLTRKYGPTGAPKQTVQEMDSDTEEKLKSLGYLK